MTRRYAVYARQSIDKADSISIETQIERCLYEVGDAPYEIYADRGYSGKNTDRPQFQQMMKAVQSGKICCVVCYKLDRCSRSILDFTQLMNLFQRYDVSFTSCTEKFDTATPLGRAMLNICIVFAQLERETIQQRITDAYHSRCKKGYFMGGRVPFGFSLVPHVLDGKKTSCYECVENEAEILRKIYSAYKEPGTSLSDVVGVLYTLQLPNPRRRDGLWIRPHIARMIKNPIYVMADSQVYDYNGCYLYHIEDEQHLVLAPHKGIIPPEVWLKCQKGKLKGKRIQTPQTPVSWLTGKLTCLKCGRAVIVRQTTGRNGQIYRYFVCSACRGKYRVCEGFKPFSAQKVESAIENAIINRIRSISNGAYNCIRSENSAEIFHKMKEYLEISGEISSRDLEKTLLRLIGLVQSERDESPLPFQISPGLWSNLSERLSRWESIPANQKIRIAQRLIETVKLSDSKVVIVWRD